MAILFGTMEYKLNELLNTIMKQNDIEECYINHEFRMKSLCKQFESVETVNVSNRVETAVCFSKNIVCIAGIYLPVPTHPSECMNTELVEVESMRNNLKKIALGISSNRVICLQGPVGSGKTSLVEYLAEKTGHILGDTLIKIQLSDQTDNKMLLGTYQCTDIPGEFVWQPGVLTQVFG